MAQQPSKFQPEVISTIHNIIKFNLKPGENDEALITHLRFADDELDNDMHINFYYPHICHHVQLDY